MSDTPYMRKGEYVLFNEAKIREQVLEAKNKAARSEIRNASRLSDPTAAEAIRNIMPVAAVIVDGQVLKYPEYWLDVIDKTKIWCRQCGEIYYRIMRARYCGEKIGNICAQLSISDDYFYRTLDKIRNYAAMWAAWYHLVIF